jgi:hypothetical protein
MTMADEDTQALQWEHIAELLRQRLNQDQEIPAMFARTTEPESKKNWWAGWRIGK